MISYFFVLTLMNPSSSCMCPEQSKSASPSQSLRARMHRTYRLVNGPNVARQALYATLYQPCHALQHLRPLFGAGSTRVKHLTPASDHQSIVTAQHQATEHALVRR